jgi:dimethylaniline monooxygenase (N-oxide forming)
MVPPASTENRDLVFLGKVHTGSTAMLAEVQALWAVAYLNGELELPERNERERECADFTAWSGKRYLALGEKMPYTLFDYQTVSPFHFFEFRYNFVNLYKYIDALLLDIGLNPNRKSWRIMDWFTPYTPKDYKGLVQEYVDLQMRKIEERFNGPAKQKRGGIYWIIGLSLTITVALLLTAILIMPV